MAIAIADVAVGRPGQGFNGLAWKAVDVTFDNSYPIGGYSLTPNNFGLSNFLIVLPSAPTGYVPEFDYAAQKLKFFRGTVGTHTHVENTAGAYTQNAVTGSAVSSVQQLSLVELVNASAALNGIVGRVFAVGTV